MRAYILSAFIVLTSVTASSAQTMPTMPPSTFPEADTFCGVLTLCPKEVAKPGA